MARKWSDPTIKLMGILPGVIGFTAILARDIVSATFALLSLDLVGVMLSFSYSLMALVGAYLLWSVYHMETMPDVDTSLFVVFKDPAKAKYWKHRRIPMCEFYEFYLDGEVDWNPKCEGGDCYLVLRNHRDKFVNYKVTMRQVLWLIVQFLPQWLTGGSGLGFGSSSGKTVDETTKEISEHYDKGNDIFASFLGKSMLYTCGIFEGVPEFASDHGSHEKSASDGTLEKAQTKKLDMICDKLQLKHTDKLLDIGCGWGTLVRHAHLTYGANAQGVTLSKEGKKYCDDANQAAGVSAKIHHCDYRDLPDVDKFDKISAIEMAEHVGIVNFKDPFLTKVKSLLKKEGLFMMQVAGLRMGSNWQDVAWGLWMGKYVFPGADASTPLNWYVRQMEAAGFEVHSVENIGNHYAHTLHKWYDNLVTHKEDIISGKISAISEHSTGQHCYRLNELAWAWATIHAAQGGGTCYQILGHHSDYEFPRDRWVDGNHVSTDAVTGVGTKMKRTDETRVNKAFVKLA